MSSTLPVLAERGQTARQDFGGQQLQTAAETAIAAVAARERAEVEAAFVMAERHPRNWDTVRVRLLEHCDRPGFAAIARYQKPTGRKKVNGQWVDTFAEGLSARFAETARQEMMNVKTSAAAIYEDDMVRIVRTSVIDLERNTHDFRDTVVAKAVEKRGKQHKDTGEWLPPEGRDVISQRINTYGEPSYLVRATDDEIRSKQNSEISKSQRDESLRMIPKDIRDDCEAKILATLADPKKVDPTAAKKKLIDSFATLKVTPDDLRDYCGTATEKLSPAQLNELRGLYTAIRDGEIDFATALRMKFDQPSTSEAEREAAAMEAIEKSKAAAAQKQQQNPTQTTAAAETKPAEPAAQKETAAPTKVDEYDDPVARQQAQEEKERTGDRQKPVFGRRG